MAIPNKQRDQKISQRAANVVASSKSQSTNVVSKVSEQKSNKDEDTTMPMSKMNYILMGVSLFLIVFGFYLMSGSSNEGPTFNNDVFSSTRIVVAPFITFMGFLCMIPAILYKGRKGNGNNPDVDTDESNAAPQGNIIVKNK